MDINERHYLACPVVLESHSFRSLGLFHNNSLSRDQWSWNFGHECCLAGNIDDHTWVPRFFQFEKEETCVGVLGAIWRWRATLRIHPRDSFTRETVQYTQMGFIVGSMFSIFVNSQYPISWEEGKENR